MPDIFSEFGGRALPKGVANDPFAEFGGRASTEPGSSAQTAINEQHPDLGLWERTKVQNLTGGQDTVAVNHLKSLGFEAQPLGNFRFAIRKPGGKWYQTERSGGWPELSDLSDVVGGVVTGAGMVGGVVIGTPVGAATGTVVAGPLGTVPGGFAGGVAGSAAGGALAERGLHDIGEGLLGMKMTPEESIAAMKHEALAGAVGEVGGRALGYAGKKIVERFPAVGQAADRVGEFLKRPLKLEKAKDALGREIMAGQDVRAGVTYAATGMLPQKETLRRADIGVATAGLERKEAASEFRQQMLERVRNADSAAEEGIARGRAEAKGLKFEPSPATATRRLETQIIEEGGKKRVNIPSEIARPDWGVTAKALEGSPEVGAIMRKWFGEEFVPVMEGGLKRGSHAMLQREARLGGLIAEKGPEWAQKASTGFAQDMAAYMVGHPEFRTGLPSEVLADLAETAQGQVTQEGAATVMRTLSSKLSGRAISPRLQSAQTAFEDAIINRMRKKTSMLSSREARLLAAANDARVSQTARTALARADYSALSPKAPYADFQATWLGGRMVPPALQALTTKPAAWVGRRASAGLGEAIQRLAKLKPHLSEEQLRRIVALGAQAGAREKTSHR